MNLSKPAQHLKSKVDEWRQFAPSLRVTMLDDGVQVIDNRQPCSEFVAHTSPLYWSKK
jgi:hypothetical protein